MKFQFIGYTIGFVSLILIPTTTGAEGDSNSLTYPQQRDWSRTLKPFRHGESPLPKTTRNLCTDDRVLLPPIRTSRMSFKSSTIDYVSTVLVWWNTKRIFNSNIGIFLAQVELKKFYSCLGRLNQLIYFQRVISRKQLLLWFLKKSAIYANGIVLFSQNRNCNWFTRMNIV